MPLQIVLVQIVPVQIVAVPASQPPPPMPPPKSVLRAQQRAAETLSDLSLTSGEGFSIPDDGFDESSSVGASTIEGF